MANLAINPAENDGAMFSHAAIISMSRADLRTRKQVQPLPALETDAGVSVLPDQYIDLCGGKEGTARMLAEVIFKYQPLPNGKAFLEQYRDGGYWLVFTYAEWGEIGKCRKEQAKYRLEQLVALGLIEMKTMKYKGRGVRKQGVRLFVAEGAASIKGRPDFSAIRAKTLMSHQSKNSDAYINKQSDNQEETLTHCYAGKAAKGTQGGGEEKNPQGGGEETKQNQKPALIDSLQHPLLTNALERARDVWETMTHHKGFPRPVMDADQLSKLERIVFRVTKAEGAGNVDEFLRLVLDDWETFRQAAGEVGKATYAPKYPSVGFLLKYLHVYLEDRQPAAA